MNFFWVYLQIALGIICVSLVLHNDDPTIDVQIIGVQIIVCVTLILLQVHYSNKKFKKCENCMQPKFLHDKIKYPNFDSICYNFTTKKRVFN